MSKVTYTCVKDVWIQKDFVDTIYDREVTTRQAQYRTFITGKAYIGQAANHPETRQEGVMFFNHQGEQHFISTPFLNEHFVKVDSAVA